MEVRFSGKDVLFSLRLWFLTGFDFSDDQRKEEKSKRQERSFEFGNVLREENVSRRRESGKFAI